MEVQWSLVLFTVIAGAGAWLFAWAMAAALAGRAQLPGKVTSIVSFALLVVGGVASVTHLKHVDRILEALNRPTSGIFVEAALIGVLCALIAVYFILLVRGSAETPRKVLGALVGVVGIVFSFECGMSYLMEAREAWMSVTLPLAYAGTAAALGAGAYLLLAAVLPAELGGDAQDAQAGAVAFAGLLACAAGVLGCVCAAAYAGYAGAWIAGAEGALTWIVVAIAACAVVAVCGVVAWRKPAVGAGAGAGAVVLGAAGAIALRVAMWVVGTPLMDFFLMPLE